MLVDERIEAFWEAWPDVRPLLEADLAAGEYGPGTQLLTDMVEALHSDLEWDIRPGLVAVNALCLTSGDHRLRPLTGRWVAVAPPADTQWEFHPARTPIGPEVFDIDDHEIDPSQATFVAEIDPDAEHLSITVAHPEFRSLDEANRFQATFRMIDDLLGEDGTEKWIGSVDATPGSLHQPAPLTDLPRVVDELAAAQDVDPQTLRQRRLRTERRVRQSLARNRKKPPASRRWKRNYRRRWVIVGSSSLADCSRVCWCFTGTSILRRRLSRRTGRNVTRTSCTTTKSNRTRAGT